VTLFPPEAPFHAIAAVLRIGAIGVAITSLEELSRPHDTKPGGILDVEVQLARRRSLARLSSRFTTTSLRGGVLALTWFRLFGALSLVAGAQVFAVARLGSIVVAISSLLLRLESTTGTHASGSMATTTFLACGLGTAVGSDRAMSFALAFIAANACLAYLVSGLRKLQEPRWRSGQAIAVNASTLMWGNQRTALLLRGHPNVGLALCWTTIMIECLLPTALLVPIPVGFVLISLAASMHVAIAIDMGLNCFVWSFVATYPAIVYCAGWLHHIGV
jgi:hypothetical protein